MRALSLISLVLLLSSSAALAQSAEQEAGDTSEVDKADKGPLRERIVPVSGNLFLKKGRFEVSPSATLSLRDAFFTKYVFGGSLTYHLSESLAVGLRGGYSIPVVSGAAQICITETTGDGATRGCRPPAYAEINGRTPGQITLLAGVDAQWAPIYGKVALLAESFLHFDLYGIGGATVVQYRGPTADGITTKFTVGGNVGGGMRFFLNRWLSVRTELRDVIYLEEVQPLPSVSFRHQLLFELGLSLFFPTTFGES